MHDGQIQKAILSWIQLDPWEITVLVIYYNLISIAIQRGTDPMIYGWRSRQRHISGNKLMLTCSMYNNFLVLKLPLYLVQCYCMTIQIPHLSEVTVFNITISLLQFNNSLSFCSLEEIFQTGLWLTCRLTLKHCNYIIIHDKLDFNYFLISSYRVFITLVAYHPVHNPYHVIPYN